jgi:hypothetical protein
MSAFTGFFIFLVVLMLWRGGDDFRWVGHKTEEIGKDIADFGDFADKALTLRKKIMGTTEQLVDNANSIQKKTKKAEKENFTPQQEVKKEPYNSN